MPHDTDALSIYGACGEFAVPARAWRFMLALAERYGWQPRGTTPPDELAVEEGIWQGEQSDWDGRYFPALGQNVTEADAKELAVALERALPDIPDHDAVKDKAEGNVIELPWSWFNKSAVAMTLIEAFSGSTKDYLRSFIEHCREDGGLWLW